MSLTQKIAASAAIISLMALSGTALAATKPNPHANPNAPGQNKLNCFSGTSDNLGYGGTCAIALSGKTATLSNNSSNPNGDYSGVFYPNSTYIGQTLGNVSALGYSYSGNISPLPGDLSLNFLTSSGDYVYVDAFYCPGTNGVVDVINDPNCGIWYQSIEYSNWAALVAANPTVTIADIPFIVAERTPSEPSAVWQVSNIHLGQPTNASGH